LNGTMTEYSDERTPRARATILVIGGPDSQRLANELQALADTMVARPSDALALLTLRDVDVVVIDESVGEPGLRELLAETAVLRPLAVCLLVARDAGAHPDAAGVTVLPASIEPGALSAVCTLALRAAAAARTARGLEHENRRLRRAEAGGPVVGVEDIGPLERYEGLLTRSPAMGRVLGVLRRIEATDTPLVVLGEMGSGRIQVAEAIHARSRRRERPFVALTLGGLSDTHREAELLGVAHGAGPGTPGAFLEADGGTLFLDDVADATPALQASLLRVLEDGTVTPVGGDRPRRVDVRILSGTSRHLGDLVRQGLFRRDLYERLHAAAIELPPLRDRPEDIFVLARQFLALASLAMGRKPPGISREARAALETHAWPGNVRELRNVMERAALLCKSGLVIAADLPIGWSRTSGPGSALPSAAAIPIPPGGSTLKELEREIFLKTLELAGGNQSRAAQMLGLCESTFRFRLHKLGIASRRTPSPPSQFAATAQLVARG
jgi:DNA-binding NtrC family response regulator